MSDWPRWNCCGGTHSAGHTEDCPQILREEWELQKREHSPEFQAYMERLLCLLDEKKIAEDFEPERDESTVNGEHGEHPAGAGGPQEHGTGDSQRQPGPVPAEHAPPDGPDFFAQVALEAEAAMAKWPDEEIYHRLAALSGEVGELAEGVIKRAPDVLREAVQVAACAYRCWKTLRGSRPALAGSRAKMCGGCAHEPHVGPCPGFGNKYWPGSGYDRCDCTSRAALSGDQETELRTELNHLSPEDS